MNLPTHHFNSNIVTTPQLKYLMALSTPDQYRLRRTRVKFFLFIDSINLFIGTTLIAEDTQTRVLLGTGNIRCASEVAMGAYKD